MTQSGGRAHVCERQSPTELAPELQGTLALDRAIDAERIKSMSTPPAPITRETRCGESRASCQVRRRGGRHANRLLNSTIHLDSFPFRYGRAVSRSPRRAAAPLTFAVGSLTRCRRAHSGGMPCGASPGAVDGRITARRDADQEGLVVVWDAVARSFSARWTAVPYTKVSSISNRCL